MHGLHALQIAACLLNFWCKWYVLLNSFPECSTNTSSADEGVIGKGYLWLWCRIIYIGSMIPIFSWTKANTQDAIVTDTTTSDNSSLPFTITSSIIVQLNPDDNGVTFTCKITFQLPNNAEGNTPDYEYTWKYTTSVMCKNCSTNRTLLVFVHLYFSYHCKLLTPVPQPNNTS